MKHHREADGRILVNLARGEDLRSKIEGLARDLGVQAARVSAIGALEDPVLGWWDLEARVYHKQVFPGVWELVSLDGNLSLLEGKPFLHMHATISGHDYAVKGGHLFEGKVGVMVELFMDPYPTPLARKMSEDVGLPAWQPGG